MIIHLAEGEIQDVIAEGSPALIAFTVEWSDSCRVIEATLGDLSSTYGHKLKVYKINADKAPEAKLMHSICGFPTTLLYNKTVEIKRFVGVPDKSAIERQIDSI